MNLGRRGLTVAFAAAVLCALAACGTMPQPGGPASYDVYDGPLNVPVPIPPPSDGALAGGAAARAIECTTRIDGGYSAPDTYREVVARAPDKDLARALAYGSSAVGTQLRADLHPVRIERDRQLWVYDEGGVPRFAIVFAHGTTPAHRTGWWIEAWAGCNVSEFPPKVAAGLGIQLWYDAEDQPVPTYQVMSSAGARHCDWQSATFLAVGGDGFGGIRSPGSGYVRDPDGVLAGLVDGYRASMPLPADAQSTGWHRDGKTLWLAADGSAAYVGEPGRSVERWPRLPDEFGCA